MSEKPRRAKSQPGNPAWERMANRVARDFAPTLLPCKGCGRPRVDGYCCTACGDGR